MKTNSARFIMRYVVIGMTMMVLTLVPSLGSLPLTNPALAQQPVFNTPFLTDLQLKDYSAMGADQIRAFWASAGGTARLKEEWSDAMVEFSNPETETIVTAQTSCRPANCTEGRAVGRDYFAQVVGRLKDVPMSDFAVDALVAWEPYEDTSACWNPLATTWKMNVVCYFNCLRRDEAGNCILGVQHYQNQDMGVQATANTLNQGYYDAIRRMLRLETFDREGLRAALRTWGTCSGQSCDSLLKKWEDLWNEHSGNDSTVISSDSFKVLQPGQTDEIIFDVQNTGRVTWTPQGDYTLINTNGVSLGASPIQTLITEVPPGRIARWVIPITAPSQAGVNWTEWQMAYNEESFGAMMAGLIIVAPEGEIDFDLLALLEEWVNELEEQISAELNEFWEDLTRLLQRSLDRQMDLKTRD